MNLLPTRSRAARCPRRNQWKGKTKSTDLTTTIMHMAYSITALSTLCKMPLLSMMLSRSSLIPRAETFSKSSRLSDKKAKSRKRMPSATTQISRNSSWASWRSNSYSWGVKAQCNKMLRKSKSSKNNLERGFRRWLRMAAILCWKRLNRCSISSSSKRLVRSSTKVNKLDSVRRQPMSFSSNANLRKSWCFPSFKR